jgi:uncharacterized protein
LEEGSASHLDDFSRRKRVSNERGLNNLCLTDRKIEQYDFSVFSAISAISAVNGFLEEHMNYKDVSIPCGTLTLEGVLDTPDAAGNPAPAAVLCHPHPMFGGNMHNNVIRALKKGLNQRGLICLRFNFRGTGQSWGTHDNGKGEIDDVLAAVDFLHTLDHVDPNRLILAGYSFGCWVGLKAATRDLRLKRLIGISPPVDSYDFGFLENETRPKLLLAGDRDFVCSVDRFRELLDRIPEPKKGVILPGVDHFHVGGEDVLMRETDAFLDAFPFESA